jgi:hypothetical protein
VSRLRGRWNGVRGAMSAGGGAHCAPRKSVWHELSVAYHNNAPDRLRRPLLALGFVG